ncbi:peptidoglycan editing factor PgeF [Elusimicrobiota bacterium]
MKAKGALYLEHWSVDPAGSFLYSQNLKKTFPEISITVSCKTAGNMKTVAVREKWLNNIGLSLSSVALAYQVHGKRVIAADDAFKIDHHDRPKADGWVTRRADLALGVSIADCLPLFLFDIKNKIKGAFHVGWRGLKEGMVEEAMAAVKNIGAKKETLSAVIGPHINQCCYEVREDISGYFPSEHLMEKNNKTFLNLKSCVIDKLNEAGASSIYASQDCTKCMPERYISYRNKDKGVMLALVRN